MSISSNIRKIREQKGLHADLYDYLKSMGNNYDELLNKFNVAKQNEVNRGGRLSKLHSLSRKLQKLKRPKPKK